jgi:hypothetical protein
MKYLYCGMMPESQSFGVREVLQRHPLLCNSELKHVSMATNIYTTVKELLGVLSLISPSQFSVGQRCLAW